MRLVLLVNIISARLLSVNQWKNTSTVIKWFENLQNKQKRRFMKFDNEDFYPLITEHKTREAISLAPKSLLYRKHEIWVKKDNSSSEVTMESFDGAEICEIVGLYLLDKLSNLLGKENVGVYRDDGYAAINSCSGPVLDRTRKNIIALFKKEGFLPRPTFLMLLLT